LLPVPPSQSKGSAIVALLVSVAVIVVVIVGDWLALCRAKRNHCSARNYSLYMCILWLLHTYKYAQHKYKHKCRERIIQCMKWAIIFAVNQRQCSSSIGNILVVSPLLPIQTLDFFLRFRFFICRFFLPILKSIQCAFCMLIFLDSCLGHQKRICHAKRLGGDNLLLPPATMAA